MTRGKPFFSGMTKSQLIEKIQTEIGSFTLDQEFESPLISDLIAEKHYYCSGKGIRPTQFRKTYRPGAAYDFWGLFPNHGWHMVSWMQCIKPRDELDWLKRILRDAAYPIVSLYKSLHPICERCALKNSEHVDHAHPEFNVIASQIIGKLNESQIDEIFDCFDWWSKDPFALPTDHPAAQLIDDAHRTAKLIAVCKQCHLVNAKERRAL